MFVFLRHVRMCEMSGWQIFGHMFSWADAGHNSSAHFAVLRAKTLYMMDVAGEYVWCFTHVWFRLGFLLTDKSELLRASYAC